MGFKMIKYVKKATYMTSCYGMTSFQGVVMTDCVPFMIGFFTKYENAIMTDQGH